MAQALAAVTLWAHTHMAWVRPESERLPCTHSGSKSMISVILGPAFRWIYIAGLMKIMPERHQGQLTVHPQFR